MQGTKTIRTKGTRAHTKKYWRYALISQGLFSLFLIVGWRVRAWGLGLVCLLKSAMGLWIAIPAASSLPALSFIQALPTRLSGLAGESDQLWQPHWWRSLAMTASYQKISFVAPSRGLPARFARSLGSTCQVLIPRLLGMWALISLPSGQLCFVGNEGYAQFGASEPQLLRLFPFHNAGSRRRAGCRPIVRGTVRNPNDHPHGGRTKAIKYPRTPWGLTAKKSRAPRVLSKLRALSKRPLRHQNTVLPFWA